jgi:hypothetical protein
MIKNVTAAQDLQRLMKMVKLFRIFAIIWSKNYA